MTTAIRNLHIADAAEDFDAQFQAGEWQQAGGSVQSAMFALRALFTLQQEAPHLLAFIGTGKRLVDYGCALGDGTAVLSAVFPTLEITGCDISAEAVATAATRWPSLKFVQDDIRSPTHNAHCIWTSHTVEHLVDPLAALRALQKRCRILAAVFPPIRETPVVGPHVGAPVTTEWLRDMEHPLFQAQFSTHRRDPSQDENGKKCLLLEESLLYMWRGTHQL